MRTWILPLPLALPIAVTSANAGVYPAELPWTFSAYGWLKSGLPGLPAVKPPDAKLFLADKAILVAPLSFENGRLRTFVCAYRASELPFPEGTQILRVLVPDRVEWVHVKVDPELSYQPESAILSIPREFDRPLPLGPWHEVKYSVERKDGLLLVRPARIMDGIFAVEALLPTRGDWVRIALTPGSWLVQLGWTKEFNIITLDGRTIFKGRAPYDEMQYDLDNVKIAFWVCGYFVDLKGRKWLKDWIVKAFSKGVYVSDIIDEIAKECGMLYITPANYDEAKFICGKGLIVKILTKVPIILEFSVKKSVLSIGYIEYGPGTFYSRKYLEHHHYPPQVEDRNIISKVTVFLVYVALPTYVVLCYIYDRACKTYQSLPLFLAILTAPRARRTGERS